MQTANPSSPVLGCSSYRHGCVTVLWQDTSIGCGRLFSALHHFLPQFGGSQRLQPLGEVSPNASVMFFKSCWPHVSIDVCSSVNWFRRPHMQESIRSYERTTGCIQRAALALCEETQHYLNCNGTSPSVQHGSLYRGLWNYNAGRHAQHLLQHNVQFLSKAKYGGQSHTCNGTLQVDFFLMWALYFCCLLCKQHTLLALKTWQIRETLRTAHT